MRAWLSSMRSTVSPRLRSVCSTFSGSLSLSDVAVDTWQAAVPPADGTGQAWPPPGVFREMVPRLSGSAFRHRFEAPCYMRLDGFSPEFRFAAGP